jgi:hypothetical protein
MDWKAQLEGGESIITKLQTGSGPSGAKIIRDGIGWYLESPEFTVLSDHQEVRAKANSILNDLVTASGATGEAGNVAVGSIIRIHYDNSKSVFRAEG